MFKTFALAVVILFALSGAIFAWILWALLSDPVLWFDGPEPNTIEYFLTLDRVALLTFVSVAVFLVLSVAGLVAALALYQGRNAGRVGVAIVMASVLVMSTVDWILEGTTRDLITLAAVATAVLFSEWLLFFFQPVAAVFRSPTSE